MLEKLEVLRDMVHGLDYSGYMGDSQAQKNKSYYYWYEPSFRF